MNRSEESIVAGALWETPTVVVDARAHPLVIVRYRAPVAEWDFERHLRVMSSVLRLGRRTAVIMDTTDGAARSPRALALLREWMEQERELIQTQLVGIAFVIPSPAMRFLLSIMLGVDVTYPYEVFDSTSSALRYARTKLATAA